MILQASFVLLGKADGGNEVRPTTTEGLRASLVDLRFEATFIVLEGEIAVTFRRAPTVARAGETVNVPANAPHGFRNESSQIARMLCICSPAGQEEFLASIGQLVPTRTATPPELDAAGMEALKATAAGLAPTFRTVLLPPTWR